MNDLISVIVPVYNVSTYLPECIESILLQSYSKILVILIDDGSTDGSGNICDEYAKMDKRIKVIHQKNGGAASAKNAGLKIANGKYLSFVDSDDYLAPDAYSHMVDILDENHADVVQCSYCDVFRDHIEEHIIKKETFDTIEFLALFTTDWTCALLWDKLYRKSLFDGAFFETGHKIDDEYFTYLGIMNAKKIIRDSQIVYNYRKRASSVMYAPDSSKQIIEDRIDFLKKRRKNVLAQVPQLRSIYDNHFLEMMIIISREEYVTNRHLKLIKNALKEYFFEKKHTKPNYRLWIPLCKLLLSSSTKIINHQSDITVKNNLESFYE